MSTGSVAMAGDLDTASTITTTTTTADTACCSTLWRWTFGRVGEDWLFLALMGTIMAVISFVMDYFIAHLHATRIYLFKEILSGNILLQYFGWLMMPMLLILFAAGFVYIVSPQAVGSGIPEMKTILRGVILSEYLTFRTLVAKIVGLTCALGSGLPIGKEGPFVHVASIVATLLSKMVSSFQGIHDNESQTTEMLAAACAVGVAATFYAPIGGILFSIEVTSVFFAVRNYWRGFFAACCGATMWRLFAVWFRNEEAITALFKTNFRSDFPFDPQELIAFALVGVMSGFGGALFVKAHRQIVHFFRKHKRLNAVLNYNRFIYPGVVTLIVMTINFPPFLGQYIAATMNTHEQIHDLFSNVTWASNSTDADRLRMVKHWSTDHTSIFFNLSANVIILTLTSLISATVPVPSGIFTPVFKIGAAFGRLAGETMAVLFPMGLDFGGYTCPIVPGGYAVVGAAAFTGAVTHTISVSVIVFEMTGQMTHIIPVIVSVLISNAISQTLDLSIYDSIIQIKKLPFLPPIMTTSSTAHNIHVEDIMVKDIIYIWHNCTYRDIKNVISKHHNLQTFPLVHAPTNMILLGSIHRDELARLAHGRLSRQRRLQEVRRRYSIHEPATVVVPKIEPTVLVDNNDDKDDKEGSKLLGDTVALTIDNADSSDETSRERRSSKRLSRFEVTPVESGNSPTESPESSDSLEKSPNESEQNTNSSDVEENVDTLVSANIEPNQELITVQPQPQQQLLQLPQTSSGEKTVTGGPPRPPKSILKHTVSFTYSPNATVTGISMQESRLRQAFENIFLKSLKLQDANPEKAKEKQREMTNQAHRRVQLPKERVIDMSPEEQLAWEEEQLNSVVDFKECLVDPAPFQLVERTTLLKVHSMFSMLGLTHAYVTSIGRLVGVVALKDLRVGIEKMNAGLLVPKNLPHRPLSN